MTSNPDDTEEVRYSPAEYELEIWVEEDENGILYARYIVGYYVAGTPDEYYPDTPGDGKLDPTPGTVIPGDPEEIGENYSDLIFTNRYWKTDGKPGPDPDVNALEIKKLVTGNNPNLSTYYTFSVTVKTPDAVGATTPKTYNAYVADKDGNYVDLDATGNPNTKSGTSTTPAADYITFTSGIAGEVQLKHDERLVFFDLEVGSEVLVYETIATNARVKYSRTFSNPGVDFNMPIGTSDTWGFPRNPGDVGPHYTIEGVRGNIATFTNNMSGNPPTGISVDNLPYIVLISVVIVGFVAFVVIKSRKNAKHDA